MPRAGGQCLRSWMTWRGRWTWSSVCPSRPVSHLQGQRDLLRIPARPPGISTMKKWRWLAVAVLVALLAWTAAGPYRTVNAIRDAAQARDAQAMAEQVDFPALRSSLKAQLGDRLLREVGTPSPDNPIAAFGLGIAGGLVGGLVDVMVTPSGPGASTEELRVGQACVHTFGSWVLQ